VVVPGEQHWADGVLEKFVAELTGVAVVLLSEVWCMEQKAKFSHEIFAVLRKLKEALRTQMLTDVWISKFTTLEQLLRRPFTRPETIGSCIHMEVVSYLAIDVGFEPGCQGHVLQEEGECDVVAPKSSQDHIVAAVDNSKIEEVPTWEEHHVQVTGDVFASGKIFDSLEVRVLPHAEYHTATATVSSEDVDGRLKLVYLLPPLSVSTMPRYPVIGEFPYLGSKVLEVGNLILAS
jgi:hypothetical protein